MLSDEELKSILDNSFVEFDSYFDELGIVKTSVTYKTRYFSDGAEEETVYGSALLYVMDGSDKVNLLYLADSVSGDLLYTVESAANYNPFETRLFVVLEIMGLSEDVQCHQLRVDMILKIEKLLSFLSAPVYFTFLPETIMTKDDVEYKPTIEQLVSAGHHLNVGPDNALICLSRFLDG